MSKTLTRRQSEILKFLLDNQPSHDYPPTVAELARALGAASRSAVYRHVQALVQAGLVQPLNGRRRGIRLTPRAFEQARGVPFVGYIAAGQPIEAIENPEPIEVPAFLTRSGDCFVLCVQGDSMIDEGILDGDWIVVERRDHARNGDIVVALIDAQEATLKRFEQRAGRIVLHPANPAMQPLVFNPERVQIQGVLVGQMRSY